MIQYISVTNYVNETLTIPLNESSASTGLLIKKIDGIGQPKANINLVDMAGSDVKRYSSANMNTRNIVFTFTLMDTDMSIEEARHVAYQYFPSKTKIHLIFSTDIRTLSIDGYVESIEPEIFESMEYVTVSIICNDPFFYSEDNSTSSSLMDEQYGMIPKFTFPFINESTTENELIFGEYKERTEKVIEYEGEAETGLVITIHFIKPISDVSIINSYTGERLLLDASLLTNIISGSEMFLSGDTISIVTSIGNRAVSLYREGAVYNILSLLTKRDWLTIKPGENVFVVTTTDTIHDLNVVCMFEYSITYLGV